MWIRIVLPLGGFRSQTVAPPAVLPVPVSSKHTPPQFSHYRLPLVSHFSIWNWARVPHPSA